VFDDKVLKKSFGQKREEVAEDGRKLHSEKFMTCHLHKIFFGAYIKKDKIGGACSTSGRNDCCIQFFGGETRKKEPLGSPRHRGEYNIKMDLY